MKHWFITVGLAIFHSIGLMLAIFHEALVYYNISITVGATASNIS